MGHDDAVDRTLRLYAICYIKKHVQNDHMNRFPYSLHHVILAGIYLSNRNNSAQQANVETFRAMIVATSHNELVHEHT